jgi:radical SAM superfamily enzyme YgiQ (UPF0313 family)
MQCVANRSPIYTVTYLCRHLFGAVIGYDLEQVLHCSAVAEFWEVKLTSIYIVNPRCDHPGYYTLDIFGASGRSPATLIADLTIATLAALTPDDFDVILCDENIEEVDFDFRPDFVALTGKVSQWGRMKELAGRFRAAGITVLIGGPHASLSPDLVRPHCDILVQGEIEGIYKQLFSDLASGNWKSHYAGSKPALTERIIPRWDLYNNSRALSGTLQSSRGCPFDCEFCDVIEYLGRKQRHKQVDDVLAELDALYDVGYRSVFLADDNFTAYRARARALVEGLRQWNAARPDGENVQFVTQVSIDASRDPELLQACADAGLQHVFIGIETPNQDSLAISGKRQNLRDNLTAQIEEFVKNGIAVDGGMIVGFDGDRPDIFRIQYEFASSTPVPIFTLGALVAPAATRLHDRLSKEKRLIEGGAELAEVAASPWSTNIEPLHMTRDELFRGIRWLCNALYRPEAFGQRVHRMIDLFGTNHQPDFVPSKPTRNVQVECLDVISKVRRLGHAETAMVNSIMPRLRDFPNLAASVIVSLTRYAQIRYMYSQSQFWVDDLSTLQNDVYAGEVNLLDVA